MKSDEPILVARLKRGDKKAFEQLFHRYVERIYYFSLKYLADQYEAEETTQEVFVKLWDNRARLKEDLSFKSYLFMVCRNAVIDVFRKRKIHLEACKEMAARIETLSLTPDDVYEYNNLVRVLEEFVAALPEKRRKIYQLSRERGHSHKAIALELGISVKTVETQIRLAIKQLRGILEKNQSGAGIGVGGMLFLQFII
jgi:RNA polymerase sigma-70 factor, ECF subfamily